MKIDIQVIVFILIVPLLGASQSKFSFGINVNAQVNALQIGNSQAPSGIEERGETGREYAIGLQVEYDLRSTAFLRSGLNYHSSNYRHRIEGFRFSTDINEMDSTVENNINVSSIGIPLDFGYRINSKNERLKYILGFGVLFNINIDTNTNAKVISQTMEDFELPGANNEVQDSSLSIGLFGGIELALGSNLILGVEPNVRFAPKTFNLYLYDTEGTTQVEAGITIRVRI